MIDCYDCLDNSQRETDSLSLFPVSGSVYSASERETSIPIDRFLIHDFPILFSRSFIMVLKKSETNYYEYFWEDKTILEVLVTTTKPGTVFFDHEGGQTVFQFQKYPEGFRFSGITSVP